MRDPWESLKIFLQTLILLTGDELGSLTMDIRDSSLIVSDS